VIDAVLDRCFGGFVRYDVDVLVPILRQLNRSFVDFDAGFFETVSYCKAAVLPVATIGDKFGAERVALDVLQDFEVVLACLNREAFKAALVDVAGAGCAVGGVPSLGVGHCYPVHECRQITIFARPE